MTTPAASARADRWLHATRFFKTRSQAAAACAAGKVKRDGRPLKAATPLHPGDRLEAPFPEGPGVRKITVVSPIETRVSAPLAQACYEEQTSPEVIEQRRVWHEARREAGTGRPTKRDRRLIGRIRGFFE